MQAAEGLCFKVPPKYCQVTEQDLEDNPASALSKLLYNRSLTHSYLNDSRSALSDATQSLNFNPKNYLSYFQRGNILLELRSYRPAYSDFMEVVKITKSPRLVKQKTEAIRRAILQQALFESLKSQTAPQKPKQVPKIVQQISTLNFDFDHFTIEDAKRLINELKEKKMLSHDCVSRMINKMHELHELLPNIVSIERPKPGNVIKVVGDTHGQFQDLLYIFERFGDPTTENPYLFNGDYVDRGSQGLEILLTLFSWKIANPKAIYFNRGNHETDLMNNPYGFENECIAKLSLELFRKFSNMFGTLPVGHIIGGKVLVVHGGLFSDESVTIETIQGLIRYGQPPESGPMNDILWSDPMDRPGHAPSPRGVTQTFGPDVTEKFLKANNLELLIRSHQVQAEGYLVQHNGKCITVFSAPNYIGKIGNKGAVVFISFAEDGSLNSPKFEQFTAQPIPPNYMPMKFSNLGSLYMRSPLKF